jgi:hypothetical protein
MREMSHQPQEFSHDALPPDGFLQSFDSPNVDMIQEPQPHDSNVTLFTSEASTGIEDPVESTSEQAEIESPSENDPAPAEAAKQNNVYPKYIYRVSGNTAPVDLEQLDKDMHEVLQERRDTLHFPNEKPLTDEEWALLQGEHDGIVAVGDELGVDLRDRLPRRQDYHMFDSQEALSEDATPRFGEGATVNGGFRHPEAGIVWARRGDYVVNTSGLVHETAHEVAIDTITMGVVSETVDENGILQRSMNNPKTHSGYYEDVTCNANDVSILSEIATEMITARAMDYAGHNNVHFSFGALDAIADAMVREAAEHYDMPPRELADSFMRGALTGDRAGIILLQEAIGEERISLLEQATYIDNDVGEELARAMNLPRAVRAIQRAREGRRMGIFQWD